MSNLQAEITTYQAMKERLLAEFPELADDDRTLHDTLDGECSLTDAIIAIVRSAEFDRSLVAALSIRMEELKQRQERLERRIESKRAIVADAMEKVVIRKLECAECTISLRHLADKVIVTDEAQIPDEYKVTPPPKVSLSAIKAAMAEGKEIPGAVKSNGGVGLTIRRA